MTEIMYHPTDVGKTVLNVRGKLSKIRKYHMTIEEMDKTRSRWEESIVGESSELRDLAGNYFFNPFRQGIYFYQIKAMYLLGSNKYHSLADILDKIEEIMRNIPSRKEGVSLNKWEEYRTKNHQEHAVKIKDHKGRIQENMIFFQRLSKLHPTGYKLHQVRAAVDIKRVSKEGFSDGIYYYRLSTYKSDSEALPIKDFKEFNFPKHEGKYINYNFIGTVITPNGVIVKGKMHEVSSV